MVYKQNISIYYLCEFIIYAYSSCLQERERINFPDDCIYKIREKEKQRDDVVNICKLFTLATSAVVSVSAVVVHIFHIVENSE